MHYDIEANPPTLDEINAHYGKNASRTHLIFLLSLALPWIVYNLVYVPLFLPIGAMIVIKFLHTIALAELGVGRAENVISSQLCAEVTDWCKEVPQIDTYVKKVILQKREITIKEYISIQSYHRDAVEKSKKQLLYGAWSN